MNTASIDSILNYRKKNMSILTDFSKIYLKKDATTCCQLAV